MAIITIGTVTPVLLYPATGEVVLIANRDITNSIIVGPDPGMFNPQGSSGQIQFLNVTQIDPLSFSVFDGSDPVYGISLAGNVQVQVTAGSTYWSPSPAQVAAQINALGLMKDTTGQLINTTTGGTTSAVNSTNLSVIAQTSGDTIANEIAVAGVPAINKKTTTQAANGQAIAAGATATLTAITNINQPAYNLHFTATAGASSTKPWYTVVLKWVDTASGFTVQTDAFTFFMSGTSNVMSGVIYGPTDADQLQISVTNNDTVAMTLNTAFFILSSRSNYTTDYCYQFWTTASMPSVPTFQLGPSTPLPTQKVLFSVNRSVGIGVTTSPDYALPVFSGQVAIHTDGTGSNNWDFRFTDKITGTLIYRKTNTGAPATQNEIFIFPRAPVTMNITNNGTVSGIANVEVTAL